MKKELRVLLLIMFSLPELLQAQKTINVTGNTLKDGDISYAYSVGEIVTFSLTPNCLYTQGVIQPAQQHIGSANFYLFGISNQISIYPNPVRDFIVIETNYPDLGSYRITASDGRVVETNKFNYLPINVRRLQGGLYLITLFSSDYKLKETFKIMKL